MRLQEPLDLSIGRFDGTMLVIPDAARLVEAFFASERSSFGPNSYDAWTTDTPSTKVVERDLDVLNSSFRAQIRRRDLWASLITAQPLEWLVQLDKTWDLVDTADEAWDDDGISQRVRSALLAIISAPGRGGVSQATKLLHLKRPRLVPVLDGFVREAIRGPVVDQGSIEQRADRTIAMIEHLRNQVANVDAELHAIRDHLLAVEIERSLCRILDAALWCSQSTEWRELSKVFSRWRDEDAAGA